MGAASPARGLYDRAERIEADLIVVGSRGYRPLRRVLLGSVSRALVRSATSPVMIHPRSTHEPARERDRRRRKLPREGGGMSAAPSGHPVLLCYDGSDTAATAIAVAARVLRGREAVVCHAWTGVSRAVFNSNAGDLPAALLEAAEELDVLDRDEAECLTAAGVRLASDAGLSRRTARRARAP